MAETSGFFQSQWDDDLKNPITEQYTGWWDRDYYWKQFCDYFALFIGNGVFGSPTNQLKVIPGTGLSVIVSSGWAFINGAWYHNDQNKEIVLASNGQSSGRVDSIKVRFSDSDRTITVGAYTGDTSVIRGETVYELKIAEVIVQPNAVTISATDITDTRTDEEVCGLVKGLMEIETTADLFAQYEAQFNAWFDTVKDQVTGDLAIRLQNEFEQINSDIQQYEENVVDYQGDVTQQIADYKSDIQKDIQNYEQQIAQQISGYNTNYQQTLNVAQTAVTDATALVNDYVNNDYVIPEQEFIFVDKICTISDSKVKATSLIDVYFTAETVSEAEYCKITVDSSVGTITLTAEEQPTSTIRGYIRVRVN